MGRAPRGWALLLLCCAAPHLLRMALPVTTVTDSSYPHAAWMLSEGFTPYVQFTQVAFPLAEGALAAAMALCGHDLRVVETCNLLVVLAVAATLAAVARRMVRCTHAAASSTAASSATHIAVEAAAWRAGIVAALAWSWSAWVVHFNLFERETWAAFGTALALLALFATIPAALTGAVRDLRDQRGQRDGGDAGAASDSSSAGAAGWRRAWAIGGALALGCCIKLTVLLPASGLIAHQALTGKLREALRTAVAFVALLGAATLLCWWAWGTPFLQQVFLFGFFRNPNVGGPLAALQRLAGFTDPLLALMLAALLVFGLPSLRRPAGAAALMLLAELGYLLVVSPTLWSHNLISLSLPGALLLGGVAAAWSTGLALRMAAALAVVLAGVLALPDKYMPDMSASPRALAPYVEGWSRDGIARTAAFVQLNSAHGDVVCTVQPAYSLQAGRVEFLRYLDLQPLALALEAAVRHDGLAATWAARQGPLLLGPAGTPEPGSIAPDDPRLGKFGPYVGRQLACGLAHDRPLLLDAVARREIALVVEPLPPLLLTADDLRAAGYERFEDHELGLAGWKPSGGVGRRVVRDLFAR